MEERQSMQRPGVTYTLDNAWQNTRERLALLEALTDPYTIRHLEALGVAPGWRCWEAAGRACRGRGAAPSTPLGAEKRRTFVRGWVPDSLAASFVSA